MLTLVPGISLADPDRAAVESLLSAREPKGAAAALRALGEGTDRVLCAIAADDKSPPLRRLRALSSLALVPTELGRDLCREIVRKESAAQRGMATLEVAACTGTLAAFNDDLLPPLLDHPNAEVRRAAARALAIVPSAAAALRRRLAIEPDEPTRRALADSLRRLAP